MEIKKITDSRQWNNWLKDNKRRNCFTQSWEWGNILLAEGKEAERLAVVENGEKLAQAQIVYLRLPFGWQYAFCPQGPIESSKLKVESDKVYEQLVKYLKNKNCILLRIEPNAIIHNSKFIIHRTIDTNPSATLILDLSKSEKELLAGMRQKTRYNIHLAEKKDLKISREKNLEVFWLLMNQTGKRDKFKLHSKNHYKQVLNSPISFQLTAYFNNAPIAAAVFAAFGDTFTYLYGASNYARRDLMAPYLLQWEGIKIGKSLGCEWYDFFGVAPVTDGKYDLYHQYAGVTRFKLGFDGVSQQTAGTWDIIIDNKKYKLYNLLRRLRRLF